MSEWQCNSPKRRNDRVDRAVRTSLLLCLAQREYSRPRTSAMDLSVSVPSPNIMHIGTPLTPRHGLPGSEVNYFSPQPGSIRRLSRRQRLPQLPYSSGGVAALLSAARTKGGSYKPARSAVIISMPMISNICSWGKNVDLPFVLNFHFGSRHNTRGVPSHT